VFRFGPGAAGVRGRVVLAGAFAGYAWHVGGVDTAQEEVRVMDLRRGRLARRAPGFAGALRPESFVAVGRIGVTDRGRVAWSVTVTSIGGPEVRQVDRSDARGIAVLDRRADIDVSSLTVRGTVASWRDGTGARRAILR
jgi:hypothetical protein